MVKIFEKIEDSLKVIEDLYLTNLDNYIYKNFSYNLDSNKVEIVSDWKTEDEEGSTVINVVKLPQYDFFIVDEVSIGDCSKGTYTDKKLKNLSYTDCIDFLKIRIVDLEFTKNFDLMHMWSSACEECNSSNISNSCYTTECNDCGHIDDTKSKINKEGWRF